MNKLETKNLNDALYHASYSKNLELVKYLVEKGATNLDTALFNASIYNNIEMVKYLAENGATNLNNSLDIASLNNNLEMVKYLKFYKFIRENNICPGKYKNLLILVR